ncbi:MAG: hypothetical protein IIU35_03040 [Neisseriaceae bacterium]|nr:hypothetical protein [Neisseriaceae bacterium]
MAYVVWFGYELTVFSGSLKLVDIKILDKVGILAQKIPLYWALFYVFIPPLNFQGQKI